MKQKLKNGTKYVIKKVIKSFVLGLMFIGSIVQEKNKGGKI